MILTSVQFEDQNDQIFSVELWQVGQVLHLLMALLMQRTARLPAPHLALLRILPSLSLSLSFGTSVAGFDIHRRFSGLDIKIDDKLEELERPPDDA